MSVRKAVIIGAGPAGLTAGLELLERTDVKPVIYEMTDEIGGISRTVNYKGNRIDIGGHRFFSKSDTVMNWWQKIMPLQGAPARDDIILNRSVPTPGNPDTDDPEKTDNVLLIRRRLSRIFFLQKFFDYPISLNINTISNLGLTRIVKTGISYIRSGLFKINPEKSLEDFFINRFGRELYLTFFKDYTEKVWGVPCYHIKPEWGAQRIKGLSITSAIIHAIRNAFSKDTSIDQKNTETSLIEQFTYPKLGPGQMWEEVARLIKKKGGEIHTGHHVTGLKSSGDRITEARIINTATGESSAVNGDFFFSTMPVKDLIAGIDGNVPEAARTVAAGLIYRDFVTVGLLLKKMKITNHTKTPTVNNIVPDNWIYIQESSVKLGRLQIFNNWSPYLVANSNNVWLGLEYFCNINDDIWGKTDGEFVRFAIDELASINIIEKEDVLDSVVIRTPNTYPAYFGTYDRFDAVREYTDSLRNLFLIGRNGMHRYNNQDHSMLTAITAVDNIANNISSKDNIWAVNAEKEYSESGISSVARQEKPSRS